MSDDHRPLHEQLLAHLAELKLTGIAETYRAVLDEAARKSSSVLEVLAILIGEEVARRRERAVARRIRQAKLPPRKSLSTPWAIRRVKGESPCVGPGRLT